MEKTLAFLEPKHLPNSFLNMRSSLLVGVVEDGSGQLP
jgi:hypothetical protein